MKVISILSQKGGVGKTTISTCLAVAAENAGHKTAIFDLDPQATASFWHDVRGEDVPAVISMQSVRLSSMLDAAKEAGTDVVFIDGAAVARDIAYEAAKYSSYVLVPTKAAVFDTMSMTHTIDIVKQHNIPFSVVLNFVPPSGQETSDAEETARELGANLCPTRLGNRKSYFRAQGEGRAVQEYEPRGKAADEIKQLYMYVCMQVGMCAEGGGA